MAAKKKAKKSDAKVEFKLTRFEKARIIGSRALQIAMGAPLLIKFSEEEFEKLKYNPISIARLELEKDLIPMTVERPLPLPKKHDGKN